MSEKPYLLLLALPGSVQNYAAGLKRIRDALPGKVELIFTYQNGAAIGFTSGEPAIDVKLRLSESFRGAVDFLILELGKDWNSAGFNVAYRWLRANVHDPTLKPPPSTA